MRSTPVMARDWPTWTMASWAASVAQTSVKPLVWLMARPPTEKVGWMEGTAQLTLPMSVLPVEATSISRKPRDRLGVLAVGAGERAVAVQGFVGDAVPLDFDRGAAGCCAGLEAALDAGLEVAQVFGLEGADGELAFGAVGDDVGCGSAVGDDAVDA